jgi:hypothetical protein
LAGGTYLDRQRYGTWLSPYGVLAAPVAGVTALAYSLAPTLGFVPLHPEVAWLWLLALAVYWSVGTALLWPLQGRLRHQNLAASAGDRTRTGAPAASIRQDEDAYWPAIWLAWVALAVMAVGLQVALASAGGWRSLGTDAFRNIFGRGLYGHANVFSLLLLIYLLGSHRLREPLTIATVGAIIAAALIYGVKGWLILPVLAGIFYRVNAGRLRVTPRLVLAIGAAGVAMFFGIYLVRFAADGTRSLVDPNTYGDLARHFATYLFAGVLGLSEFLRLGRAAVTVNEPLAIFAPFVNLYRFFLQPDMPLVIIINPNYLVISPAYQKLSNVPTLVGTLWLYWGTAGMLFYMGGLSAVMHLSFGSSLWLRNCWLLVLWSFWAALLSVSWFEMYFWHLTSIEIPALALAMIGITAIWSRGSLRWRQKAPA